MPTPRRFIIKPREQVIGDPNPYHGARNIMNRWHQWHVMMDFPATRAIEALRVSAHFAAGRGGRVIFKIPLFGYRAPRGNKTGTVTLNGAHTVGAVSLTITGGSGTLLAGDWISINQTTNVPRAYLVTSSETGGVIGIVPGLRAAERAAIPSPTSTTGPVYRLDGDRRRPRLPSGRAIATARSLPAVRGRVPDRAAGQPVTGGRAGP